MWCRPLLRLEDGQKIMRIPPKHVPLDDAYTAMSKRKKSQPWYEAGTDHPLVMIKPQGILLVDLDLMSPAIAAYLKERLPTYCEYSYSGNGLHFYALTDLTLLLGRKHLVFQIGSNPGEKLEFFLSIQPTIVTNNHAVYRPLTNCDLEVVSLVEDLKQKYPGNYRGRNVCVDTTQRFQRDGFYPWLNGRAEIPQKTKLGILQRIWNTPLYAYERDYWLPFYEEEEAKRLGMLPRALSKHLKELEYQEWLFRRHGRYTSGMCSLALKLNVQEG